jgi:nuclear pore complex protein Nup85
VLLSANDTFELMRQLEEITTGATYAPEQYLGSLYRLTQPTSSSNKATRATSDNRLLPSRVQQEKDKARDIEGMRLALKGLDAVRLAAVRNLSRVSMMGLPVL